MRETTLFNFPSLSSLTITSKDDPFHKDPLKPIPIQHDTYTYSKKKSGKRIKWATFHRKLLSKVPFAKYQQQQYRPHRLSHYGVLQRRQIGTGASATVRMTHRIEDNGEMRVYAIKAFRKRKARETEASFMKKLISEFCISSTLDHINIVKTVDLVVDDKNRYCTVMEYVRYFYIYFINIL
jgi:hypothetical protein